MATTHYRSEWRHCFATMGKSWSNKILWILRKYNWLCGLDSCCLKIVNQDVLLSGVILKSQVRQVYTWFQQTRRESIFHLLMPSSFLSRSTKEWKKGSSSMNPDSFDILSTFHLCSHFVHCLWDTTAPSQTNTPTQRRHMRKNLKMKEI